MIETTPGCPRVAECTNARIELQSLKAQYATAKATAEIANERQAELEQRLEAASGATIVGRERETIKQLQRNDLTQRKDLDLAYDKISEQRQEIERLEKLCRINKVEYAKPSLIITPPASKPATGWGAITGNTGAGNP